MKSSVNSHSDLRRFLTLLTILLVYFIYLGLKFGATSGLIVAFLSWSFFVLCTPIADAGFLLDFPLRFLLGIRMFISEIFVWLVAITGNIAVLIFAADEYEKTFLTSLFHKILTKPYPYWAVIFLSMIGTFLSIKFGDDIYDAVSDHKNKKLRRDLKMKFILFIAVFSITAVLYYHLLESLNIQIK